MDEPSDSQAGPIERTWLRWGFDTLAIVDGELARRLRAEVAKEPPKSPPAFAGRLPAAAETGRIAHLSEPPEAAHPGHSTLAARTLRLFFAIELPAILHNAGALGELERFVALQTRLAVDPQQETLTWLFDGYVVNANESLQAPITDRLLHPGPVYLRRPDGVWLPVSFDGQGIAHGDLGRDSPHRFALAGRRVLDAEGRLVRQLTALP